MAKEFKFYDVKFADMKRTDAMEPKEDQEMANLIKVWRVPVESWIMQDVRHAVYEAPDYLEWQKFRVSMKGQSTGMKLFRLGMYWASARATHGEGSVSRKIFKIRVDNYIGALVRGGQLNSKLEIVR